MELSEVKWFKYQPGKQDPETNIKAKSGDLGTKKGVAATDFSGGPIPLTINNTPDPAYGQYLSRLDDNAVRQKVEGKNLYQLKFKNVGGLISPIVIEWTFADGTKEIETVPAEVWRINEQEVSRVFKKDKEVVNIVVDPRAATADINTSNNTFPRKVEETKFDQLKKGN